MAKNNYANYTHAQLVEELKKLNKRKKYGLVWEEEKTKEKFEAEAEGKLPILTEDKKREINGDTKNPTHILIEGDNYHALSVLNYTHAKSIDVMYFDPPYNTGSNDFKYNDKFVDDEDSFRHSKWLSFMNKRLKLAKNLLKDTGVIFISIDDNEIGQLRLLCNEIFYEKNDLGITVRVSNSAKNNSNNISITHDYCLVYAKNKEKLSKNWIVPKNNWKEFRRISQRLYKKDVSIEQIEEELKILTKYPRFYDFDHYYYCDNIDVYRTDNPGGVKSGNLVTDIIHPTTMKPCKKPSGGWRYSEATIKDMSKNNLWHFGVDENTIPAPKRYLKDYLFQKPNGIQFYDQQIDTKWFKKLNLNFDNPKPVEYIKQLIRMTGIKDGYVLDIFGGSGTTGHAVLELNKEDDGKRQFILCTNDEGNICTEVCYPRVKKAIEGYKSEANKIEGLGGNLKYYKTNFVGSEPTHRNKKLLTEKSIEMLCIRENTFVEVLSKKAIFIFKNEKKYTAILFEEMKMDEFKKEIKKLKLPVSVYVFSLEGDDFSEDFEDIKNDITLCSIPEAILKVYRRIYETAKPKK